VGGPLSIPEGLMLPPDASPRFATARAAAARRRLLLRDSAAQLAVVHSSDCRPLRRRKVTRKRPPPADFNPSRRHTSAQASACLPLGVSARPGSPGPFRCQRRARLIQVLNSGTDFRLPLRQDFGEDDSPRYGQNEGSHDNPYFGAQSHGFGTRCLRFVGWVAPALHAKLASGCWPGFAGWAWLPTGLC
jgi:hypothetical protein